MDFEAAAPLTAYVTSAQSGFIVELRNGMLMTSNSTSSRGPSACFVLGLYHLERYLHRRCSTVLPSGERVPMNSLRWPPVTSLR